MVAPIVAAAARGAATKAATKTAAEKAATRAASRKRDNERKKLRRKTDKLYQQLENAKGKDAARIKSQIKTNERTIQESYYNRKSQSYGNISVEELTQSYRESEKVIERFYRFQRQMTPEQIARVNEIEKMKSRSASLAPGQVEKNVEQKLVRAQEAFVFSRTRELWQGTDTSRTWETIIEKLQGVELQDGTKIQTILHVKQYIKELYPDQYPTPDNLNVMSTMEWTQVYEDFAKAAITPSQWRAYGVDA